MFSYLYWMPEKDRAAAEDVVSRSGTGRLDIHLCRGCIQRGSQADAGSSDVSQSRSPDAGRSRHPASCPARGSLHTVVKLYSDGCPTFLPAPPFSLYIGF